MTRRLNVAARLLAYAALSTFLWLQCALAHTDGSGVADTSPKAQQSKESAAAADADADADGDCNSLTGPFCVHTGSMALFAPYMTPISPRDLQLEGSEVSRRSAKTDEGVDWQRKKCFFQHFSGSWMDSGGDTNDIMSQQVASVDECEKLCCEHTACQSFTYWRGRTCFLRAQSNTPRQDSDSFSGIRLT
ncbi:hypothetical protein PRIC1_013077 [Phytophthora ramorum]|nr:hypothetical protein KRP22_9466 [Phytophthora ramorum]